MSYILKDFYLYLDSKNATSDTYNFKLYSYRIKTKYGDLYISVGETNKFNKDGKPYKKAKVFSIFCCFEDFDKAKLFLDKYHGKMVFTGKWNFCFTNWNETLENFKRELDKIT